ncbi:cupin domain-containing protein [Balneolaceae bacterium ANBcel3]|nr:cupin domain-containing protein [Balneolaceae bacterium ANBcel3]
MNNLSIKIIVFITFSFLVMMAVGCTDPQEYQNEEAVVFDESREPVGPWVLDIEQSTKENAYYRHVIWTGRYMQLVLMSLKPGEVIDLEVHHDHDQFIRIEQGEARVLMGETEENLTYEKKAYDDWAILIPAGYWHKIINAGDVELKLYTLYAPPEHQKGTLHRTYEDAAEYHHDHH